MTRPDPRPELSAAHSMDTLWFAVDDDGHVFEMDSGENGAVPTALTEANATPPWRATLVLRLIGWRAHLQPDEVTPDDDVAVRVEPGADTTGLTHVIDDWYLAPPLDAAGLDALRRRPGVHLASLSDLPTPGFAAAWDAPIVYTPVDDDGRRPQLIRWPDVPAELRVGIRHARLPGAHGGAAWIDLLRHFAVDELTFYNDLNEDLLRGQDAPDDVLAYVRRRYLRGTGDPNDPLIEVVLPEHPETPAIIVDAGQPTQPGAERVDADEPASTWWRRLWRRVRG